MAQIVISFNDKGQAEFHIDVEKNEQILAALLGLEGYFGVVTGLEASDIREIMDEEKGAINVRPANDDVIDVEEER